MLIALLRFEGPAATLEEAGYATVASIDLAPFFGVFSPSDVRVDGNGFIYVAGTIFNAPTGAQRIGVGGGPDILVVKFDPAGQIVYKTVIGGDGYDYVNAIRIDSSGHVVIAANTSSTNFPLQNAMQSAPGDGYTWAICRLSPDGASLLYSTYYGTGWNDRFGGLAVAANGEAVLAGSTSSTGAARSYGKIIVVSRACGLADCVVLDGIGGQNIGLWYMEGRARRVNL